MNASGAKNKLSAKEREELLEILQGRFEKHPARHKGIGWAKVQARLEAGPAKIWALQEMEKTGGEPDVVGQDKESGEVIFFDCSPESPKGRTSICYDAEALASRKEHKPRTSAMDLAKGMGTGLLTEDEYRYLQTLGEFDMKTSSWIRTPSEIRMRGGALFGDRRFGRVFIYHNGAQSYYGARGFRSVLKV